MLLAESCNPRIDEQVKQGCGMIEVCDKRKRST